MKERTRLDQVPSELACEIKELILEDPYTVDPRWGGCLAKLTITGVGSPVLKIQFIAQLRIWTQEIGQSPEEGCPFRQRHLVAQ